MTTKYNIKDTIEVNIASKIYSSTERDNAPCYTKKALKEFNEKDACKKSIVFRFKS